MWIKSYKVRFFFFEDYFALHRGYILGRLANCWLAVFVNNVSLLEPKSKVNKHHLDAKHVLADQLQVENCVNWNFG